MDKTWLIVKSGCSRLNTAMVKKQEDILDAAIRVFVRYGVQRSTMGDVAKEAGVARQTLYNAFANKNEVLKGPIKLFSERSLARINAELSEGQDLGTQLAVIFEHSVVAPFLNLLESPNAADFIEGFNHAATEEIERQEERNRQVIERVLRSHRRNARPNGITTKQLSDFIQRSSSAAKHSAEDLKHLKVLLNTLVQMTVRTVETD